MHMPDGTIGQQRLFRLHLATRTINRLRRLSRPREYHTVGRHDNDAVTLTAYIERICGMICLFVTFRCGDKFDEQAVRKIAETARVIRIIHFVLQDVFCSTAARGATSRMSCASPCCCLACI